MPDPIKPIPSREEFAQALKEINWPKESGYKLLDAIERFHDESHAEYFNASPLQQAIKDCTESNQSMYKQTRGKFAPLERSVREYETIQQSFLLPAHMAAIERFTKRNGYAIGVRETGETTLGKLSDGCLPKPHSIREKSIKESKLKEVYGETGGQSILQMIEGAREECGIDIKGLVGHWDKDNGRLVGIHVHGMDAVRVRVEEDGRPFLLSRCKQIADKQFYFPVDVSRQDALVTSLAPLNEDLNRDWKRHAYTGDYDLHHILVKKGAGGHHPSTADSYDEKRVIRDLNCAMPGERKGSNNALESGITPHTLFQHGPQSSYYAHYLANLLKAQKQKQEPEQEQQIEPMNVKNAQPSFPQVHCDEGQWRRIVNEVELKNAYELAGVVLKPTWRNPASFEDRRPSQDASPGSIRSSQADTASSLIRKKSIIFDRNQREGSGGTGTPPRRSSGADPLAASSRRPSLEPPAAAGTLSRKNSFASDLDQRRGSGSTGEWQRSPSGSGVAPSADASRRPSLKRSSLVALSTDASSPHFSPFSPVIENPPDAASLPTAGVEASSSRLPAAPGASSGSGLFVSDYSLGMSFAGSSRAQRSLPSSLAPDQKLRSAIIDQSTDSAPHAGPSVPQRRTPPPVEPDQEPSSLVNDSTGRASRAASPTTQRRDSSSHVPDETGSERLPRTSARGEKRSPSRGGKEDTRGRTGRR